MNRRLTVLVGVVFVLFVTAWAVEYSGRVVGVIDGDTIEVLRDGQADKVRLNGVDCPEAGQAFGTRAKEFVSSLVFGRTVMIIVRDRDRYGRTVGDVLLPDGRSLSQELVRAGFAWHYTQYSSDTTLARLEREAKAGKSGLWVDAHPVAPWDWRHGGSTSTPQGFTALVGASNSDTVYVTRTGSKYHRSGCSYLRSSSTAMLLSEVTARYQPCSRCNPPRVEASGQQERAPPAVRQQERASRPAQGVTVYVTRTGGKYHTGGCSYLRRSSIPMSLQDAKASGYSPCSKCNPPR